MSLTKAEKDKLLLEERKVIALEKIASSLDALVIWVEEIDKDDWGKRVEYYLAEFYRLRKNELDDTSP